MAKYIIITWCKTKSCIYNENGECKQESIYINKSKCGSFRSNVYYNSDGTLKSKYNRV